MTKLSRHPDYSCLECKDTKEVEVQIWIRKLMNKSDDNYGERNMPFYTIPCFKCRK